MLRAGRLFGRPSSSADAAAQAGDEAGFTPLLNAGQLAETIKLGQHLGIAHVAVFIVLAVLFWPTASHAYLAALGAAVIVNVLLLVGSATWFGSRLDDARAVARGSLICSWLSFALGSSWATLPTTLFSPADADHRMVIVAVAAGLISYGLTSGPIRRNIVLFTVPIIAGSFVALVRVGGAVCSDIAVMLLIYAIFIIFSGFRASRISRERILDNIRLEQKNGTIKLLLRDFEEGTSDWLWQVDASLRLLGVPDTMQQAAGRQRDLSGLPLAALFDIPATEGDAVANAVEFGRLVETMQARLPFRDRILRLAVHGDPRWWSLTGRPIFDGAGRFAGYRGVGSDVTTAHLADLKIAELATADVLTGLANRAVLHGALQAACDRARGGGPGGILLCADLDGFKAVNDTLGHLAGDQLLREVAQRLLGCAGAQSTVARLGGDEFAIFGQDGAFDPATIGASIVSELIRPYRVGNNAAEIGVSIGIARLPADADEAQALLQCADLALYDAKAQKNCFRFYKHEIGERARDRAVLRNDLRCALANGQLEVVYQPVIRLSDGAIGGCEALLRWRHPARGLVPPAEFIPLAEADGTIIAIGNWVLQTACREAAGWRSDQRVAVNLSPLQFRDPDLLSKVVHALETSKLPPRQLELEITESVLLDTTQTTLNTLRALRSAGVRIALDDFGTGFSSLSYLLEFPFDKIKIDRSFTMGLGNRDECAAIIDAVISLSRRLGMEVTAEGVETLEQSSPLSRMGCDHLQGYLFSPARSPASLRELMELWSPFGDEIDIVGLPSPGDAPALSLSLA